MGVKGLHIYNFLGFGFQNMFEISRNILEQFKTFEKVLEQTTISGGKRFLKLC